MQNSRRITLVDIEMRGYTIPAHSFVLTALASANHDPDQYGPTSEQVDITRPNAASHVAFGGGVHHGLGAALARLEGRVALDEFLNRFPEWDVDTDNIELAPTTTVRGWQRMPIVFP